MILERLEQFASAWFDRAKGARDNKPEHATKFPILPELCDDEVHAMLHESTAEVHVAR